MWKIVFLAQPHFFFVLPYSASLRYAPTWPCTVVKHPAPEGGLPSPYSLFCFFYPVYPSHYEETQPLSHELASVLFEQSVGIIVFLLPTTKGPFRKNWSLPWCPEYWQSQVSDRHPFYFSLCEFQFISVFFTAGSNLVSIYLQFCSVVPIGSWLWTNYTQSPYNKPV